MRSWASRLERARRALALVLALSAGLAGATEVELRSPALLPGEDGYQLSAEVRLELNSVLEDVVARGVPLYFVLQAEVTRSRWYWFDEELAERSVTYRLSYHALTRQYRLSTGALHQSFATLGEALGVMERVRALTVAERGALKPGERYDVAVRFALDLGQLPKPLQVTAIGRKEWSLDSGWVRFPYVAGEAR